MHDASVGGLSVSSAEGKDSAHQRFYDALEANDIEAVRALLAGVDPAWRDSRPDAKSRLGALSIAAERDNAEMIHLLLAVFDAAGEDGKAALERAMGRRLTKAACALIPHCDCSVRGAAGATLLHAATAFGFDEAFDALLPRSNIDARDNKGATALLEAMRMGNARAVKALVQAGANVHLAKRVAFGDDSYKETPFQLAREKWDAMHIQNRADCVAAILPRLDPAFEDAQGWTPLIWAVRLGELQMVEAFANKAAAAKRSHIGQDAFDIATQQATHAPSPAERDAALLVLDCMARFVDEKRAQIILERFGREPLGQLAARAEARDLVAVLEAANSREKESNDSLRPRVRLAPRVL